MRIKSHTKCAKPGCLSVAKVIPVIQIPLGKGTVGPTRFHNRMPSPGVIQFDARCGNHKSDKPRDYIDEACQQEFEQKCAERGLTAIWGDMSITFEPIWKMELFNTGTISMKKVRAKDRDELARVIEDLERNA